MGCSSCVKSSSSNEKKLRAIKLLRGYSRQSEHVCFCLVYLLSPNHDETITCYIFQHASSKVSGDTTSNFRPNSDSTSIPFANAGPTTTYDCKATEATAALYQKKMASFLSRFHSLDCPRRLTTLYHSNMCIFF